MAFSIDRSGHDAAVVDDMSPTYWLITAPHDGPFCDFPIESVFPEGFNDEISVRISPRSASVWPGVTRFLPMVIVTGEAGLVHFVPVRSIEAITSEVATEEPQSVASFWMMSHCRMRSISDDEGSTAANASSIRAVVPMRPIDHHD